MHFSRFVFNISMCMIKGSIGTVLVGRTWLGTYDVQDAPYDVQDALYNLKMLYSTMYTM